MRLRPAVFIQFVSAQHPFNFIKMTIYISQKSGLSDCERIDFVD